MQAEEPGSLVQATERLTIKQIELIPVLVPLSREYRGSYYGMTRHSPISRR